MSNRIRVSIVKFSDVPAYDVFNLDGDLYRKRVRGEARLNNITDAKVVKIEPNTLVRWTHALTDEQLAIEEIDNIDITVDPVVYI